MQKRFSTKEWGNYCVSESHLVICRTTGGVWRQASDQTERGEWSRRLLNQSAKQELRGLDQDPVRPVSLSSGSQHIQGFQISCFIPLRSILWSQRRIHPVGHTHVLLRSIYCVNKGPHLLIQMFREVWGSSQPPIC